MALPELTVVFCGKCRAPLFTCERKAEGAKIWHKNCDPRIDLPLPKQRTINVEKVSNYDHEN